MANSKTRTGAERITSSRLARPKALHKLLTSVDNLWPVARLLHWIDGDTFHVPIRLGFGMEYTPPKGFRLTEGLDAPEMHSSNDLEIRAAKAVAFTVQKLSMSLFETGTIYVATKESDLYGRPLCTLWYLGKQEEVLVDLNQKFVSLGILRKYDPKKKRPAWTNPELQAVIDACAKV